MGKEAVNGKLGGTNGDGEAAGSRAEMRSLEDRLEQSRQGDGNLELV